MAPSGNKIAITVVVSGQPVSITLNPHQKVDHLIREALQSSGNQGHPVEEWELRSTDGTLFESGATVEAVGIVDGITVYLNPRAGAGGH